MAPLRTPTVHDHVALAEIEWCGELMIAASAVDGERLSPDRIDEVLNVRGGTARSAPVATGTPNSPTERALRGVTRYRGE